MGGSTLTPTELREKTVRHIGEYLEQDVSHLRPESQLATMVPGLDSLKSFEMMLYLEDCFQVQFDESLIPQLETLQDLVEYIATKLESATEGTASVAV
jgi:acyl carrier protein